MVIDNMIKGYVKCALRFLLNCDGEAAEVRYGKLYIDPVCRLAIEGDCRKFLDACSERGVLLDGIDDESIGHDFFLARNTVPKTDLAMVARGFGKPTLYVDDDVRVLSLSAWWRGVGDDNREEG
jgi:hypothetical protein